MRKREWGEWKNEREEGVCSQSNVYWKNKYQTNTIFKLFVKVVFWIHISNPLLWRPNFFIRNHSTKTLTIIFSSLRLPPSTAPTINGSHQQHLLGKFFFPSFSLAFLLTNRGKRKIKWNCFLYIRGLGRFRIWAMVG